MSKTALDAAADFLEFDAARHEHGHDGCGLDKCRIGAVLITRREVATLLRAKAIEQRIDEATAALQKS